MPTVGLLSDSHGRASTTAKAVQRLIDHNVDYIIHLGDIGTIEVLDELVDWMDDDSRDVSVHVVFGNTDWDAATLARYAETLGIHVDDPVGRLSIADKTLVFQHGHREDAMQLAFAEQPDYLFHGHTHRTRDEVVGSTRIINPGALFRAADYTVAVLDVSQDKLTILQV